MVSSNPDTALRIGCGGLPSNMSRARYFERLSFLETDAVFAARVKPSVLTRWRKETPAGGAFAVLASSRITHQLTPQLAKRHRPALTADERRAAGHFADTEVVRAGLDDTLAAAERLDAEAIVFRTPASFTPTTAHRDALSRFCRERIPASIRRRATLVWDPEGVWQDDDAFELASELGLVLARDPLAPEPPELRGDVGYFRLAGLGMARRSFTDDQLDRLIVAIEDCSRAWVVFCNPDKFRDARRLARQLRT